MKNPGRITFKKAEKYFFSSINISDGNNNRNNKRKPA